MSKLKSKIEDANKIALERMVNSQPHWVDVQKAIDVCPGLKENVIMHAGPPITWDRMGSSQKNAVKGAIIYEELADSMSEADEMVKSGDVLLSPCHEHNTVGSMCGITSPSMPVLVIENKKYDNRGYVLIYEDPGRERLSFGAFSETVMNNLKWIDNVAYPVLKELINKIGSLNLKPIISKALTMGDELHSRNFASTSLFGLEIMEHLVELDFDKKAKVELANFIKRSDQFFLHHVMGAGKVTADAANGIEYSTAVTAIARNGVDVGIRVSGLPGEWFTGPAGPIEGLYFAGYSSEDAQPDMGDSAIAETTGLGAFAHASSPSLALTKGNVDLATKYTNEMREISIGENPNYGLPALEGRGTPTAIDIRKVMDTEITPAMNTGIAHKEGGQIGVGNSRAPMEAFKEALVAFNNKYN